MTTTNFSSFSGTGNTLAFNPDTDVLLFDATSISPFDVSISTSFASGTTFSHGGVSVTLTGIHAFALTPTNIVFANGGKLLIGDQTTATNTDLETGATFNGGNGNDTFYGFNGADTFNGGDGDDRIFLISAPTTSADIVNGGEGSDRVIFLGGNTSTGGFQFMTHNTNVNLGTGVATWGTSTVQLTSVEQVQVIAANGTTHVLIGGDADDVFVIGGTSGTSSATFTVDGGNGSDWLSFNTFNATAVSISLMNGSSTWGSAQISYSNIENLGGTAGNDILTGNAGNNVLRGYGGDDALFGDAGIDYARYSLDRSSYSITQTASGYTVQANAGTEGTDTLTGIERLRFNDTRIALDLTPDGNAGKSMQFIGMLAYDLIETPEIIGTILSIFDEGKTMNEVCQLAIDVGLTQALAGSNSNLDLAKLVFRNVVGTEATDDIATGLASFMQGSGGTMTQAEFLTAVAQLELNNDHVNLVGLADTGVEYIG